jgi:hypothetical protein
MKLTLDAAGPPLANIELGEPDTGYFDGADLGATGGNIYINIDGKEYGSLFFYREADGTVSVTLGAFDPDTQGWENKNPLRGPIPFPEEGS